MRLSVVKTRNNNIDEINIPIIHFNSDDFLEGTYPVNIINHKNSCNVYTCRLIKTPKYEYIKSEEDPIVGNIFISKLQRDEMLLDIDNYVKVIKTSPGDIFQLSKNTTYKLNVYIKTIEGSTRDKLTLSKDKLADMIQKQLRHICINNHYIFVIEDPDTNRYIQLSIKMSGDETNPWCYYTGEPIIINNINLSSGAYKKCLILEDSSNLQSMNMLKSLDLSKLGIGGLHTQIIELLRRVFASRACRPEMIEALNISHVKGVLLYGPPGTGKTLIARQLGKMLNSVEPIIVNGPEIMSKYVGESAENIRKLFKSAEVEYKEKGEYSKLHVIIFDEFDALAGKRTAGDSAGAQVGNQIVNQLLSKMDGVESLNNILIFGLTNRKELIDSALLRPGRFEVQLEISIPTQNGRKEIFDIHLKPSKLKNALASDVDTDYLASITDNFTGAEIAGVVRNAITFAIYREINKTDNKNFKLEKSDIITIQTQDLIQAINDLEPLFGKDDKKLDKIIMTDFTPNITQKNIIDTLTPEILRYMNSNLNQSLKLLITGFNRSGKTTTAVYLAKNLNINNIIYISNYDLIGENDSTKNNRLKELFMKATNTDTSVIIMDDIDTIMEISDTKRGFIFNNSILQTLRTLWSKTINNKIIFIATANKKEVIDDIDLFGSFHKSVVI